MRLISSKGLVPSLALLLLACNSSPPSDSTPTGGSGGTVVDAGTDGNAGASGGTSVAGASGGNVGGGGRGGSSAGAGGGGNAGGGGRGGSSAGAGGGGRGGSSAGAGGGGHGGSSAGAGGGGRGGSAAGAGGAGGAGGQFPAGCTCLGLGPPSCTPTGHVVYTLAKSAAPTGAEQSAYDAITCAMDGAVAYYNCNTTITKQLNVSFVPSVPTADGNINGSIRFGGTQYMECATAMHETAHAVGIGTDANWPTYSVGGLFTGPIAIAQLHAIPGHETDTLHSDTQHFWPFGLNQASEAMSPADLVDHCLMVTAIRKDLGLQ